MKIAIVIPTYNESGNIKNLIPAIFTILPNAYIVVVDDNSPDQTSKIVGEIIKKNSRLFLISQPYKSGRGSAVLAGFKFSLKKLNADIYIEMDADFSHDPDELPMMIDKSQQNNLVLASRYISGSKIINVPFIRRVASLIANTLIHFILKIPLHDNTNGFRCYQRTAVNLMLNHKYIAKGFLSLSESACLLRKLGFTFIEIPTIFRNRKTGKSNAKLMEFVNAFDNLIKIRTQL